MKFLMFIKHTESARSQQIPQGLMQAMGQFVTEGFERGWLKETAGLTPTSDGFRIRTGGGRLTFTDGPFSEAKEMIGGFAMVEASSRVEARALARRVMALHRVHWPEFEGECEVRALQNDGANASAPDVSCR
jgi:hypothetical protein